MTFFEIIKKVLLNILMFIVGVVVAVLIMPFAVLWLLIDIPLMFMEEIQ